MDGGQPRERLERREAWSEFVVGQEPEDELVSLARRRIRSEAAPRQIYTLTHLQTELEGRD